MWIYEENKIRFGNSPLGLEVNEAEARLFDPLGPGIRRWAPVGRCVEKAQ
jgi:hypothetical protein